MFTSYHFIIGRLKGPSPADVYGLVILVLFVHLDSAPLSPKSRVSLGECAELGLKIFQIRVSCVNKSIFNRFRLFNGDSAG